MKFAKRRHPSAPSLPQPTTAHRTWTTFQEAVRRVHSLAGSSALLRLSVTNEVAAQFEWALEEVGTREDVFDAARVEFVNRFCTLLDEHADALLANTVETAPVVTEAVTLARRITGEEESGDQSGIEEALDRVGHESSPEAASGTDETAKKKRKRK